VRPAGLLVAFGLRYRVVAHGAGVRVEGSIGRGGSVTSAGVPLPGLLIDLAAGRRPGERECDELGDTLLAQAREQRMTGLLWTWARQHCHDRDVAMSLAVEDLRVQAHLVRVTELLESCVKRLAARGFDVATIKGPTAEARWYDRKGERLCSDVDLLLAPHQIQRVAEVVDALQPDHPWRPFVTELALNGRIQAVTMRVDGIEVDLHLDLLKLGFPTRQASEIWERTTVFELPGGTTVRVLDDTSALMHLLVHLNKDRFQRLLGYADIARIIRNGNVEWPVVLHLARGEGLQTAVLCSLEVVLQTLGLRWPSELPRPRSPRAWLWRGAWHPDIRLRGTEGRLRFRRRQDLLALTARGRTVEAVGWWLRDLWPPRSIVEQRYAHIRGPYVWKVLRGRAATARHFRDALAGDLQRKRRGVAS
jgi:hypothetical protein